MDKDYKKDKSASGCSNYDGLPLFKMYSLQIWYDLSDYEVAAFSNFSGFSQKNRA